jgi:hypothetical protein
MKVGNIGRGFIAVSRAYENSESQRVQTIDNG